MAIELIPVKSGSGLTENTLQLTLTRDQKAPGIVRVFGHSTIEALPINRCQL
jgi:hypothetical protein